MGVGNGACDSPPVGEVGRENQAAGLSVRRSASRAESDSRILPDPFAVFSGFSGHGRSEKFVLLNPLPGGLARGGMRRTFRRRLEGTFAWLRPVRDDNEEIS